TTLGDPANPGEIPVEGIYMSWDTEEGDLSVTTAYPGDALLSLTAEVRSAPQWFTLNLVLGEAELEAGDTVGLVLDSHASPASNLDIFIRSSEGEAFEDTPLDRPAEMRARRSTGSMVHEVQPYSAMAGSGKFHTLIIPLPSHDVSLTLFDLRLFVLPKGSAPATIIEGSVAELIEDRATQQDVLSEA
ncbi:MAG: hypothetical protein AAFR50_11890, partial [Pseudomonadota bacterium]